MTQLNGSSSGGSKSWHTRLVALDAASVRLSSKTDSLNSILKQLQQATRSGSHTNGLTSGTMTPATGGANQRSLVASPNTTGGASTQHYNSFAAFTPVGNASTATTAASSASSSTSAAAAAAQQLSNSTMSLATPPRPSSSIRTTPALQQISALQTWLTRLAFMIEHGDGPKSNSASSSSSSASPQLTTAALSSLTSMFQSMSSAPLTSPSPTKRTALVTITSFGASAASVSVPKGRDFINGKWVRVRTGVAISPASNNSTGGHHSGEESEEEPDPFSGVPDFEEEVMSPHLRTRSVGSINGTGGSNPRLTPNSARGLDRRDAGLHEPEQHDIDEEDVADFGADEDGETEESRTRDPNADDDDPFNDIEDLPIDAQEEERRRLAEIAKGRKPHIVSGGAASRHAIVNQSKMKTMRPNVMKFMNQDTENAGEDIDEDAIVEKAKKKPLVVVQEPTHPLEARPKKSNNKQHGHHGKNTSSVSSASSSTDPLVKHKDDEEELDEFDDVDDTVVAPASVSKALAAKQRIAKARAQQATLKPVTKPQADEDALEHLDDFKEDGDDDHQEHNGQDDADAEDSDEPPSPASHKFLDPSRPKNMPGVTAFTSRRGDARALPTQKWPDIAIEPSHVRNASRRASASEERPDDLDAMSDDDDDHQKGGKGMTTIHGSPSKSTGGLSMSSFPPRHKPSASATLLANGESLGDDDFELHTPTSSSSHHLSRSCSSGGNRSGGSTASTKQYGQLSGTISADEFMGLDEFLDDDEDEQATRIPIQSNRSSKENRAKRDLNEFELTEEVEELFKQAEVARNTHVTAAKLSDSHLIKQQVSREWLLQMSALLQTQNPSAGVVLHGLSQTHPGPASSLLFGSAAAAALSSSTPTRTGSGGSSGIKSGSVWKR